MTSTLKNNLSVGNAGCAVDGDSTLYFYGAWSDNRSNTLRLTGFYIQELSE